jgi:hypothetical protein
MNMFILFLSNNSRNSFNPTWGVTAKIQILKILPIISKTESLNNFLEHPKNAITSHIEDIGLEKFLA